jgi:hypothetical protein
MGALVWLAWLSMPILGLLTGLRNWKTWLNAVWLGTLIIPAIAWWPGPGETNDTAGIVPGILAWLAGLTLILEVVGHLVGRRRRNRNAR